MYDLSGLTIHNYRACLTGLMRESCLPHDHTWYTASISLSVVEIAVKGSGYLPHFGPGMLIHIYVPLPQAPHSESLLHLKALTKALFRNSA